MDHINLSKLYDAFAQEEPEMLIELLELVEADCYRGFLHDDRLGTAAGQMAVQIEAQVKEKQGFDGEPESISVASCEVWA